MIQSFDEIFARAAARKGGKDKLMDLLGPAPDQSQLAKISDDRFLSIMTKCVFQAGFTWRVIENKWPGFEEVFHSFDIDAIIKLTPAEWDESHTDARIVRNGQKIATILPNAELIQEVSAEHGSFGRFLANWPNTDQVGLLDFFAKRGKRLGGTSAQYFLRHVGYDGFVMGNDVKAALRQSGVELSKSGTSKRDLLKTQEAINSWAEQSGLSHAHISRILAFSTGKNYHMDTVEAAIASGDIPQI